MLQDSTEITGSQELPLSQESFSGYFSDSVGLGDWNKDLILEDLLAVQEIVETQNENLEQQPLVDSPSNTEFIPASTTVSSLPALSNWKGAYGFDVLFANDEQKYSTDKKVPWVYSPEQDKLYIRKDAACPISFVTDVDVQHVANLELRVKAMFLQPNHCSDVVKRCVMHMHQDMIIGLHHFDHLIRCETEAAKYCEDEMTHELSVVIPYECPRTGEMFSSYLFKFTCFSSCKGVLDRKPIAVVFTLEKSGEVVGRRCIPTKICACPFRDCNNVIDKKKKSASSSKKRKVADEDIEIPSQPHGSQTKKTKLQKQKFTITTKDPDCYAFLKEMKRMYKLGNSIKAMNSEEKGPSLQAKVKTESSEDSSSS